MAQKDTLLHLFAGGCGGTVGAIMTCPLEVLKTRLQSSGLTLRPVFQVQLGAFNGAGVIRPGPVTPGLLQVLRSILEKEGPKSLFRGLGPNLVGVAPSRARGEKKMNAFQCARYVYKTEGMRGFYRGLTASYAGISETMICFLIYETLKKYLAQSRFTTPDTDTEKGASDFLGLMAAAAFAKGCASCIAYPHEVIRTRLREEGSKYKYFFQTARLVAVEEGYAAFYRGLIPQLIRQIPNTAIVLSTYELIVHLLGETPK
ncbi:solute carrier family 25 member 33 isoform X2 [Carassius auratus]|uniref:Solute carrier family 25 member 33 isoform X2 n=1 Tax=Carassius auratus TaxID=7957 RepID=A0A6P6M7E4_CARAU|nr:solute carrier family 25 member 33 isoform X2 [Carassius auratus]